MSCLCVDQVFRRQTIGLYICNVHQTIYDLDVLARMKKGRRIHLAAGQFRDSLYCRGYNIVATLRTNQIWMAHVGVGKIDNLVQRSRQDRKAA